jgi:hypothetical protein
VGVGPTSVGGRGISMGVVGVGLGVLGGGIVGLTQFHTSVFHLSAVQTGDGSTWTVRDF